MVEVERVDDQTVLRYAEVGLNSLRLIGHADTIGSPKAAAELAAALAALKLQQTEGGGLAKSVSFLDLIQGGVGDATIEGMLGYARAAWAKSEDKDSASWLRAKIGRMAGNKDRALVFSANRDGVHGLVAGSTGSGKSELLIALIAGLAVNYSPTMLNFVLVDFKGGGAFEPFRGLPHCVDIVTNLNGDAVTRMFTSIRDEIERITRIGRSLGVNLLLAAQRPVGVTDQMRANIKVRICLRVEGVDTSREMLRRADAAFLPSGMPGRGYLQVGNEQIELIQVAYTGETVPDQPPNDRGEAPRFYEVVVRTAENLMQASGAARPVTPWPPALPLALTFDPPIPDYLAAGDRALLDRRQADGVALAPQVGAWLQGPAGWPAPPVDGALQPVVGLVDDPRGARQLPLVVNLNRGHAVLFGGSGTGKTSFIRSLLLSLAASHPPELLHVHLLDLGGRSLQLLTPLPHVGTVIVPDDGGYEEQVQLLWRELAATLAERKQRFGTSGAQSLSDYNARFPDSPLPAILLVVDTIAEFIDAFAQRSGESAEDSLFEQFLTLARQGKGYGLHIVITANRLSALSSKLYSLFAERLALQLADADDYAAIVGGRIPPLDELPGRGATAVERQPLSFQVALLPPVAQPDADEKAKLDRIGEHMRAALAGRVATFVPLTRLSALPERVPYRDILAHHFVIPADEAGFAAQLHQAVARSWDEQASSPDWLRVPLGVASGNLPRALTLAAQKDGVHGMIAGGTGSGKSELLMTFILGLALVYPPSVLNFVLVDYKGGGAFKPFETLPHCVEIVTNLNTSAVHRMFSAISAEIRRRQQLNAETNTKDVVDYRRRGLHRTQAYPHLMIIIDEYAEMIDSNPDYRVQLESITRVGRAQGVHLLLASQRPKGVSDQMRANIKLRLCLKVEDADTSRELLRRPDAARLPNGRPGRGFLQGAGDRIELVQVAYCGDPLPPPDTAWCAGRTARATPCPPTPRPSSATPSMWPLL